MTTLHTRSKNLLLIIVLVTMTAMSHLTFAATKIMDSSLSPMLQKVLPAVVNIKAQVKITDFSTLLEIEKQRRSGRDDRDQDQGDDQNPPGTYMSAGSGVIIDADNGYIVTNAHVIYDAQIVTVTLADGRHYNAKIIGADKPSDIALLQIKAKNLTAISIADSNKLKVGDFVAAIGNPFGLSQTVTSGIVSALGRVKLGIESYENFIQTDAPINPGNSGGALIDMQGDLVGINTAILAPNQGSVGIGFAIPANMAKSVVEQFIQYGNIKRGILGISAQDITPDLAAAFNVSITKGAAVTQVLPGSPAQRAGFQVGDIITAVNGSEVKNASDVVNTVGFLRVDSKITVSLLRNNKPLTISVVITDPKKRIEQLQQSEPYLYGVGLKDFSLLSPLYGQVEGILVTSVEEGSNAWNSDLRQGDIITSINQQKVRNISELKAAVAKSNNTLLVNVIRGQMALFLVMNHES